MILSNLIKRIDHLLAATADNSFFVSDPQITSIHYNSSDVKPGGLFVAIKGLSADGHNYIDDAINRGALAVVCEKPFSSGAVIPIVVSDSRKSLALIASEFFGNPSDSLHITGITGTNGKTTTTYLIENIFNEAGFKTGVIGTVNYRYSGRQFSNPMTTPESLDLQKILSDMAKDGVTHVVMEVSSHAIDLDRIAGCSFDTAVFTNLSQDHLDYHGTMEAYWDCKQLLFTEILAAFSENSQVSGVINCNDPKGKELSKQLNYPVITTGAGNSGIRATDVAIDINGIRGVIETPEGPFKINSKAIGSHNLENILNAAGAGLAAGVSLDMIQQGLKRFNVPGRLERLENTKGFNVFVDYAHTPDALENVLATLKPLTPGKMITVFGCGGDRDTGKRPQMGEIAETYSDLAVITSDNPRSEDPGIIIGHILEGISGTAIQYDSGHSPTSLNGKGYLVEPDRKKAISLSIKAASQGDSVLIAGKGHETYQITNSGTIDFDDRLEAKKAIESDD